MSSIYPHDRSLNEEQLASIRPKGFTRTVVFGALDPRRSSASQTACKIGLVFAGALFSLITLFVGALYVKRAYRVYTEYKSTVLKKISTVTTDVLPPGGGAAAPAPKVSFVELPATTLMEAASGGASSSTDLPGMTPTEAASGGASSSTDLPEMTPTEAASGGASSSTDLPGMTPTEAASGGASSSTDLPGMTPTEAEAFERAKRDVQRDPNEAFRNIRRYGITNQAALIAIAELTAQRAGWVVSEHIKNYGITDQAALIEIAKLAAAQRSILWGGISKHIKNYGITDQAALIEIAKLAAQRDGPEASLYLKNYGITDPQALTEIALLAVAQNPESFQFLGNYGIDSEKELCDRGIQLLHDLFVEKGVILSKNSALFKALEALREYRSFPLMNALIIEYGTFLRKATPEEAAAYLQAYEKTPNLQVHLYLPCLVLTQWGKGEGEDRANVLAFLRAQRGGLRNAATGHMQLLLRLLTDLSREAVSDETRWKLLAGATQEKNKSWAALAALSALCDNSTPSRVVKVADSTTVFQGLSEGIKALLQARGAVSSETVIDDTFWEKYGETFGQTRVPHALLLYMKRIQPLADPLLMKAAQEFVQGVLTGTFHADRYNPVRSPHLKKLAEEAPEVFAAWQSETHAKKLGVVERPTEEASTDFVAFFKQKMGDGHTKIDDEEQMPQLGHLLSNEAALIEYRSQDDPAKIPKAVSSGGAAAERRISEEEAICIQLLHPKITPEQRKTLLAALASTLNPRLELNNDIKALRKGPARSKGELTVVNSDDWQDLFLCGTEVMGSCQRIDGDSSLNRCLLAYCLDGKNRLLAVKDSSGRILARCLFRLLWDKDKDRPVLFQDRIYPAPCLAEHQKALDDLALEVASEMGCSLATCNGGEGSVRLESYGSPAPYEYEDAAGGVRVRGVFIIPNARLVN